MPEPQLLTKVQIEDTAKTLTSKVEHNESVSAELNNIPFHQRAEIAHKMETINVDHRKTNESLPKIELTFEKDGGDSEHLTDMKVTTEDKYLGFIDSTKDVYDLPKTAQTNMFDYIVDTRLNRDIQDSKHLGNTEDVYEGSGRR